MYNVKICKRGPSLIVNEKGNAFMELFDSHAHYNDEKFDNDREELIDKIYVYVFLSVFIITDC